MLILSYIFNCISVVLAVVLLMHSIEAYFNGDFDSDFIIEGSIISATTGLLAYALNSAASVLGN